MTAPRNNPSNNRVIYYSALILCLIAAIFILVRSIQTNHEHVPAGDKVWQLNWELRFHAERTGSTIQMAPPWDTAHLHLYSQHLEHFGLRILRAKKGKATRDIVALVTEPGDLILNAEFNIHHRVVASPSKAAKQPAPSPEERELYLSDEDYVQVDGETAMRTLEHLNAHKLDRDTLILTIFKHVSEHIGRDQKSGSDDAETVLRQGRGNDLGRARAMLALLRSARIPSRLVTGFHLSEHESTTPDYWLEVLIDKHWSPYDPINGHAGELPAHYLPVRRGAHQIFKLDEGAEILTFFEIRREKVPDGLFTSEQKRFSDILDLPRLSLVTRLTLGLLLLLPFGVLITVIARYIGGIRTYSVFAPTLLAFSVIYAGWVTASIVFALVAIIGIGGRSLMPGLKLSRIPRLAIVFILIAMSMTLSVSVMDYYGLNPGGFVVLLPIVVLTILVDRIYSVADEYGIAVAVIRLNWTLVMAFVVSGVLLKEAWGQWILIYPETHLISIALIILIGRYRGPKLSDAGYMTWLREPAKARQKVAPVTPLPPNS